jgi:hypothetical protein
LVTEAPQPTKQTANRPAPPRKKLLIAALATVAVALAIFGLYSRRLHAQQSSTTKANLSAVVVKHPVLPPTLLHDYLAGVATAQSNTTEQYAGQGVSATARALVDLPAKRISMSSDVRCTVADGDQKASMELSLQIDNAATYFRLNKIQGTVYFNKNGKKGEIHLDKTYAKMMGKWYKNDDVKAALSLQAESGVYAMNSGVMALPELGPDAQKIAVTLVADKAFTAEPVKRGANKYTFTLTAHRDGYAKALAQLFPNLQHQDAILDGIFGTKKTSISEEVLALADGTLLSEKTQEENLCTNYAEKFMGIKQKDASGQLLATSKPQPFGSFSIEPVSRSTPIADLAKDRVQ